MTLTAPTATDVSWARCRDLAAQVRDAKRGRAVTALIRPRTLNGLLRSRLPLPLLLWHAAREKRLVEADGAFVVLDLPGDARADLTRTGPGPRWVERLDRYWEVV